MKLRILNGLILATFLLIAAMPQGLAAQTAAESIANLQARVSNLEHQTPNHADGGVAVVLFGAFCALWAQNTGRNAWLWFFTGLIFNVITVLVLLYKNSKDQR